MSAQPTPAGPTRRTATGFGWRPDLPDHRDRIFNLEKEVKRAAALPATVDLSPHMPGIYNQMNLNSCTGNGIARVLEYESTRTGRQAETPSRLFIYYNERVIHGTMALDTGAHLRDGIKVVASLGAPPESSWPYDDANPGPFQKEPPAEVYAAARAHEALVYRRVLLEGPGAPMRTALAAGHPIVFGFSVPAYFEPKNSPWDPTREPLPVPAATDTIIGGHCVVLSGYDYSAARFAKPAFQVDNSWGESWGMGGRFWMDADWFAPHGGLASDLWVIEKVA